MRRIDVVPRDVIWRPEAVEHAMFLARSEDGTNVVLICPDSFYVLRPNGSVERNGCNEARQGRLASSPPEWSGHGRG